MNSLADKTYSIHVGSFKEGVHVIIYQIDTSFFEEEDRKMWTDINVEVHLEIHKYHNFFQVTFGMHGTMNTSCDRCVSELPLTLWDEFKATFRYAWNPSKENEQEKDPFVYYLKTGESFWDAKQWIYDFILLSIPSVRKCVGKDAEEKTYCNREVLKYILH